MRKTNVLVMVTFLGMAHQALADNPPAAAEKGSASTSAVPPAPAAAPTSSATTGEAKPAAADAAKQAAEDEAAARAQDKRYQAMGYKPVKRDGVTVYCRKESVIGTRFTRMNCNTAETLERMADSAKQEANGAMRRSLNQVQSNN